MENENARELPGHSDRQLVATALGGFALATWCIMLLLPGTTFERVSSSIVLLPLRPAGIASLQGTRLSQIWAMLGRAWWTGGLVSQVTTGAIAVLMLWRYRIFAMIAMANRTARLLLSAFLSFTLLIFLDFITSSLGIYRFGEQTKNLLLGLFALTFAMRASARWWRILMTMVAACIVLQAVYATVLYLLGFNTFTSSSVAIARATGTLEDYNPNYLYPLCLMGALLLLPSAVGEKRPALRVLYWLSLATLTTALVLTFTRSAAMGLLAGSAWFAYQNRSDKRMLRLPVAGILILLSVFGARGVSKSGQVTIDRAIPGRVQIWRVSTKIIEHNWLFGTGYGGYGDAQNRYMDSKLAHFNPMNGEAKSQALNMLACHGVPGLAVFVLFICATWSACVNGQRQDYTTWEWNTKQGIKLAGIGILTAGLVDNPLYSYDRYPGTFVWLVFMGFLLHLELRNNPPSGEWTHTKTVGRIVLIVTGIALVIGGSISLLGMADANQADKAFDKKIALQRSKPSFVPMKYTPQAIVDCELADEDCNFYYHHGYSPVDIHRALRMNIRAGRIKQGGSTITQQLAKNLFFSKDRTLRRKVAELVMAVKLEHEFTKTEILELYLNTIEYGLGTRGIGPAAKRYFGKDAGKLTDAECALLAGLVCSPPKEKLSPGQARKALKLTLSRLEETNDYRWASVEREINSAGESRWLAEHLVTEKTSVASR